MIQPNKHLLDIYRITERMDERSQFVRLDRNERVSPFPEEVFREMLNALRPESFCAYPDPSPLYSRLSRQISLPEDCLYLTNGSDAAIRMIFQTFLRPGDCVVFPDPTYAMYAIYAKIFEARAATIAYSATGRLDVDALIRLLQNGVRMLAVANPDQPVGAVIPEADLRRLAACTRETGTLFLVDEAYYPFCSQTAVPLIREFDNMIVTRTFSKAVGLAGLRLGCMAAHPAMIHHIQRIRGAHEVNAAAIAIGSYMLDHPELSDAHLADVRAGRAILIAAAQGLGLLCPDCPTNFQLIRFPGLTGTAHIVQALKEKGFLVKGEFSAPVVQDCIRITLSGPAVMQSFVKALQEAVRELGLVETSKENNGRVRS